MQNLNLWRKAESASQTQVNQATFKSVKKDPTPLVQKVTKKHVPTFKKTKTLQQKRIMRKTDLIDPKNAENELK